MTNAEKSVAELWAERMSRPDATFADRLLLVRTLFDELAALPVNMILHCPQCHTQHVDAPEPGTIWTNPPHRSHVCGFCSHVWRPSDSCTNGVKVIKTAGRLDSLPTAAMIRPVLDDLTREGGQALHDIVAEFRDATECPALTLAVLLATEIGTIIMTLIEPPDRVMALRVVDSQIRVLIHFVKDLAGRALAAQDLDPAARALGERLQ